ncbi:PH domain-containing protein [Paenimyroides ceti]
MANCILCSTELKFMNTPTFSSGKLSDGGTVCSSCFKKINNINPRVAFKLKNQSIADIKNLLEEKLTSDQQKKSRLDEIKKQIQELKLSSVSNFLGRREINELTSILAPTEIIDNLVQGIYNNGQGILVSTNRRLLFVDKGMLYGLKVEDFPLDKITSIQYQTGLLLGCIKIHTSGNIAKIENVEKASASSFAEFVRDKLSQPKETHNSTTVSQPNVLDQLEKLGKLKENGILSEEEFNEQKKKLLEKF